MNDEIQAAEHEVARLQSELADCQQQRAQIDAYLADHQGKLSAAESRRAQATSLADVQEQSKQIGMVTEELQAGRQLRANLDKLASNLQTALSHAEQAHHAAQERHRHARQQTLMASIGPDLLRPCWLAVALEVRGAPQAVGVKSAMSRLFGCLPGPDPSEIPALYEQALHGQ